MTPDDDHDLLRAWRTQARDLPDEIIDRRVLKAAERQRLRRHALPLAAALAACLALALYGARPQPVAPPVATRTMMDYSQTSAILSNPDAMEELRTRNLPGSAAPDGAS